MALVAFCTVLAILAACARAASGPDAAALAAIEDLGGKITRDARRPGRPVVRIEFQFKQLKDAALALLRPFVELETLHLDSTGITGAGLVHLKPLTRLRRLGLSANALTDESLAVLPALERLEILNLQLTRVTDAGLPRLIKLPRLRELLLSGTTVSDAGLASIEQFVELRELALDETAVTDAGLRRLRCLTKLESVSLPSAVTDRGLSELRGMTHLRELCLLPCRVTDAGLASLRELPALRYVDLRGTGVTEHGVRELERALPELETDFEPAPRVAAGPQAAAEPMLTSTESAVSMEKSGPPPSLREVLGWLSPRTETIFVARGPFTLEKPTDSEYDARLPFLRTLQYLSMGGPSGGKGTWAKLLAGQTVLRAVEGSRRFRKPCGFGMMPYDGCHIIVFREDLGPLSGKLRKALAADSQRITRVAGEVVYVFEEKLEKDWWTTHVALPQQNVLLCATDETSLEEVLQRRRERAAPRFLDDRFAGWERLSEQAPVWAMRHFTSAHRSTDGMSRVSFQYNSARRCATLSILSPNPWYLDELDTTCASARPGRTTVTRRLGSGALQIESTFADEDSLFEFLLELLGMLGHAVFI
jgi:hypothetical protein